MWVLFISQLFLRVGRDLSVVGVCGPLRKYGGPKSYLGVCHYMSRTRLAVDPLPSVFFEVVLAP